MSENILHREASGSGTNTLTLTWIAVRKYQPTSPASIHSTLQIVYINSTNSKYVSTETRSSIHQTKGCTLYTFE